MKLNTYVLPIDYFTQPIDMVLRRILRELQIDISFTIQRPKVYKQYLIKLAEGYIRDEYLAGPVESTNEDDDITFTMWLYRLLGDLGVDYTAEGMYMGDTISIGQFIDDELFNSLADKLTNNLRIDGMEEEHMTWKLSCNNQAFFLEQLGDDRILTYPTLVDENEKLSELIKLLQEHYPKVFHDIELRYLEQD